MDPRTLTRLCVCAAAALAGGCGTLRDALAPTSVGGSVGVSARGKVDPAPDAAPAPAPPLPGTVIAAAGTAQPLPPIPMPEPKPPATGGAPPAVAPAVPIAMPKPLPLPGAPPGPPPGPPPGAAYSGPTQFADPNLRATPTAYGARWNTAPAEQPIDRLVEVTKYLDAALGQNRELLTKVKELETLGKTREQALVEATREIDSLSAAARERVALLAENGALKARIQQIEDEDVKLLLKLLEFLDKNFPEKKP